MELQTKDISIEDNNYKVVFLNSDSLALTKLPELKEILQSEINNGNKYLGIDMAEVTTMNSSGLGILINCLKVAKDNKGNIKILNANDKIRNIFRITKLDTVFEFSNTD
ncbi:MAG TPA: STAS domain-containing protein [Ignavibacteria bacterium]|nr:STAS domain-containing protein [Ignavibacteria bacterium]